MGLAELVFPALNLVKQALLLRGPAFASVHAHHVTPEVNEYYGARESVYAAARRTPCKNGNPRCFPLSCMGHATIYNTLIFIFLKIKSILPQKSLR